ncbi:MAG: TolC family protein [Lachnospiraceae bacterium]|nr:TolC family protein [Lachnospiraceae bacterium]
MRKQWRCLRLLAAGMLTVFLARSPFAVMAETDGSPDTVVSITYENLEALLTAGNLDLKEKNDTYLSNKENYQKMLQELRDEQDYMKFLAEQSDDDSEEKAVYRANAAILGSSAERISKQIERLNNRTNTNSYQENIDSYLVTAQTRMISYHQMMLNAAAKEKSAQAAERSWQEMVKRQTAGMATADEVLKAADTYSEQKNLMVSYQRQAAEARRQLLTFLGISDTDSVTIAAVPEPDLAAIDAIDFEEDCRKAIGSSSSVQSARHANAGTTAEIARKFQTVETAEGSAQAEITDDYQQLLAERKNYAAAQDAFQSALLNYQALQRKRQAGMLDQEAWLTGEAEYLQAVADYGTASMALVQALEDYRWAVKGVAGGGMR